MFENLFTQKYSEQWYRNLSGADFYAPRTRYFADTKTNEKLTPNSDPEFRALPIELRREIWAAKFGLDSDTFWSMPLAQRSALINTVQGRTYGAGLDTGIKAAQSDARFTSLRSFVKGASATGTIISLVGLGLMIYINRKKLVGILPNGR